ncbi:MAG: hypothetical protein JST51_07815 [Armatimonadetes bacterium]|nr:hypothetical protein [Armatimonadota bacterium]
MERKSITVDELLAVFKRYWRSICLLTLLAGVGAAAKEYFAATKYRGTTSILVITPNVSASLSQLAVLNASAATPLRTIKGVVMSDRETRAIIDKFGLDWHKFEYEFQVTDESQTNQLVISYDSTDQKKILDLLQFTIDKLGELDEQFNFSVGTRQAVELGKELKKKEKDLASEEDKLLALQKTMKTASDPTDPQSIVAYLEAYQKLEMQLGGVKTQLKALRDQLETAAADTSVPSAIPPAVAWQKKLSEVEYRLRVARTTMAEENPEVVRLKRIEEQTKEQYQNDVKKYLTSVNKNLDPTLATLESKRILLEYQTAQARELARVAPEEGLKLGREVTEVLTLRKVVTNLRAQYEQAKIEAEVSKVRWSVLDPPYIERKPVNKRYRIPVLAAMGVVFTISMIVGFARFRKSQSA